MGASRGGISWAGRVEATSRLMNSAARREQNNWPLINHNRPACGYHTGALTLARPEPLPGSGRIWPSGRAALEKGWRVDSITTCARNSRRNLPHLLLPKLLSWIRPARLSGSLIRPILRSAGRSISRRPFDSSRSARPEICRRLARRMIIIIDRRSAQPGPARPGPTRLGAADSDQTSNRWSSSIIFLQF